MSAQKVKGAVKLVAWLLAFLLVATLWQIGFDKVWPAHGQEICSIDNPCEHPRAAKKQTREYRTGELGYTRPRHYRIPVTLERKMKRAYRRYVERQQSLAARGMPSERALMYDWPSPKEWFQDFATSVGCAFVGSTPGATSTYCGSGNNKMLDEVVALDNEVSRVSIKCGGNAILGGLASEGAKETARKMGIRLSGGFGLFAGGAHCLWNEYFDRWWWR